MNQKELEGLVLTFTCIELKKVLFAGNVSRHGLKAEMQEKVLELVRLEEPKVDYCIREIAAEKKHKRKQPKEPVQNPPVLPCLRSRATTAARSVPTPTGCQGGMVRVDYAPAAGTRDLPTSPLPATTARVALVPQLVPVTSFPIVASAVPSSSGVPRQAPISPLEVSTVPSRRTLLVTVPPETTASAHTTSVTSVSVLPSVISTAPSVRPTLSVTVPPVTAASVLTASVTSFPVLPSAVPGGPRQDAMSRPVVSTAPSVRPTISVLVPPSGTTAINGTAAARPPSLRPDASCFIPTAFAGAERFGAASHEVVFSANPFFKDFAILLKPRPLYPSRLRTLNSYTMRFGLSPYQARLFLSTDRQFRIEARVGVSDTSAEQKVSVPVGIIIKVNKNIVPLPPMIHKPGYAPKRESKPVDITSFCNKNYHCSQELEVTWTQDDEKIRVIGVYLVEEITMDTLKQQVRERERLPVEVMRKMIQEKLQDDADVCTTSLRVSVACPLTKTRIALPCRPSTCSHIQCFDLTSFLQINYSQPRWLCPVCDRPTKVKDLFIDEYFSIVLTSVGLPEICSEIELKSDTSWVPLYPKEGHGNVMLQTPSKPSANQVECINLDSDSPFVPSRPGPPSKMFHSPLKQTWREMHSQAKQGNMFPPPPVLTIDD